MCSLLLIVSTLFTNNHALSAYTECPADSTSGTCGPCYISQEVPFSACTLSCAAHACDYNDSPPYDQTTLICTDKYACIVKCNGTDACYAAHIYGDSATSLTVSCGAGSYRDCEGVQIFAESVGDVTIHCYGGNDECLNMDVHCGTGVCRIDCDSQSCGGLKVNASLSSELIAIGDVSWASMPPTNSPSKTPTNDPTMVPTWIPTSNPSNSPSNHPSASPTKDPSVSPTNPPVYAPTFDPTVNPITYDDDDEECRHDVQRVISWAMYLADDMDINSNIFRLQFGTMTLDALKDSILVTLNTEAWEWCLELADFTVSYVEYRRRLLATEVNVEAVFLYDRDLESVFKDKQDSNELKKRFSERLAELSQKRAFSESDEINVTGVAIGDAVILASNEMVAFDHVTIAIICLVSISLLLLLLGFIGSKCRGADDLTYGAIIVFGIYTWDFFSDLLFAIDIWLKYLSSTPEAEIPSTAYSQSTTELMLSVIFGCSIAFIVLPLIKNFYDLIKFQGHWQKHPLHGDRYRMWLDQFGTFLFFLSFICGSTFGSISLVNSNLFGKRIFSMGLSKLDLRRFNQKRLINVILGENLPQLFIQILYASVVVGGVTTIAFAAILSSTLSICAAVLDFASKKKLLTDDGVNQTLISVKVASTQDIFSRNVKKYQHKTYQLMAEIARIFPLDRNAIEMLPIERFSDHEYDGLLLYFFISTSRFEPIEIYNKLNAKNQAHLAKQIGKAWNLEVERMIVYDLQFLQRSQRLTTSWKTIQSEAALTKHIEMQEIIAEKSDDEDIYGGGEGGDPAITQTNASLLTKSNDNM